MSALPVRVLEAGARASAATSSTARNSIPRLNPDTPSPTTLPKNPRAAGFETSPPVSVSVSPPRPLRIKKQHLELIAPGEIEARGLGWQERARAKHTQETGAVHYLLSNPPGSPHKTHTQPRQL